MIYPVITLPCFLGDPAVFPSSPQAESTADQGRCCSLGNELQPDATDVARWVSVQIWRTWGTWEMKKVYCKSINHPVTGVRKFWPIPIPRYRMVYPILIDMNTPLCVYIYMSTMTIYTLMSHIKHNRHEYPILRHTLWIAMVPILRILKLSK